MAVLAAILFLMHPGTFVAELRGSVEIVFITCVLGALVALQAAIDSDRGTSFFLAGLIFGLACSVKSTPLLFPALVALYLMWSNRRSGSSLRIVGHFAVLYLGLALVLSPWTLRNYILAGAFIPTASVQGVAAHSGNYLCKHATPITGFLTADLAASRERADIARQLGYHFRQDYYLYFYNIQDELALNRELGRRVAKEYGAHPGLWAKCAAKNMVNFWFTGKSGTATLLNLVVQTPYLLLGILGFVVALRSGLGPRVAVLALFVVYYEAIHVPIHAQARYSLPTIPCLAIFGALALWWSYSRCAGKLGTKGTGTPK
jgi:Dolichyl-phosphate-mannose-protein mannosyltransferase